ncbi:MAG: zinc metalloprotease HtpX [Campylobacteraceae bacterium]|jgi:heat shock protein HtpX|nr:zinc metalloprotease HtpX [Campylobacteraceae bacterium]
MEVFKTIFLLTALTLLFVFIGGYIGGQSGMLIAFGIAAAMNFFSYFYSDKLVLKHYKAVEVNRQNARGFYEIVESLAQKANIPMPKVYIIPEAVPNAFATGRNPKNAAVAATEGLLNLLSKEEIEGVMAHELSHVRHYDILVGSIAATIAGAIAVIANIMQYGAMFSAGRNRQNPFIMIVIAIILPIAAMIIQMAISREREYKADEGAAKITKHPEWLQSALSKLDTYAKGGVMRQASQESAHMFIVNPFSGKNISFANLFSTHPSTADRIARLEMLKGKVQ